MSKNHSTTHIKQKWEKEWGTNISEDSWMEIWVSQSTTANSRSLREFGWKSVVRFFITPKITAMQTGNRTGAFVGDNVGHLWLIIIIFSGHAQKYNLSGKR